MSRIFAAVCIFAVVALLGSCMDAEPAEISFNCSEGGQPVNCVVQLFNTKGVQLQETFTQNGLGRFQTLKPDTYIVKFKDSNNVMYPAVRKVVLKAGDSHPIILDVKDTSTNPVEEPAK